MEATILSRLLQNSFWLMEYIVNSNFKMVNTGEDTFLIDITEKDYGRSKPVIMVNKSTLHILDLLKNHSEKEIIDIILSEGDHLCPDDELKENIISTITLLTNEQIIIPQKEIVQPRVIPTIETMGFGPMKGSLGKQRKPLVGVVEITSQCNCNCPHCYVKGLDKTKQLSTDKILTIASIFKSKGILNVTITGGEPLLHPHFKDIYLEFKQKGFLIDVFTNALLVDGEMALLFAKYPPRSLDITIYGISNDEYNTFTGIPNGYDKLCQALDLLKTNGVFFSTKMILNNQNYSKLKEYNKLAFSYKAPFRYNVVIGKGNNTIKDPAEIMLDNDKIIEIEEKDPIKIKIFQALANNCNSLPFDCNETEGWSQYVCGAGIDKVFIGYDGKMSPCMTLRNKGLDLFTYGYDYIWGYWGEQRKKKLSIKFKCMDCRFFPICTPCTEEFEQENNNKELPIEARCNLAEKRWEHFIENDKCNKK